MPQFVLHIGAIGIASGILFRSLFSLDIFFALGLCIGLCLILYGAHAKLFLSRTLLLYGVCFCVCVGVGVWRYDVFEKGIAARINAVASLVGHAQTFEGVVVRDVEERGNQKVLVVETAVTPDAKEKILVRVSTESADTFAYGDMVEVRGTLKIPEAFTTDTARTFLYAEYLAAQGVTHTVSFASVKKKEEGSFSVRRLLYAGKKICMDRMTLVLLEPQAGLAAGLLLGEKRALGTHLEDVFRTVGIMHIVVLSGYNLTIVAESVMRLLSFFFMPRTRLLFGVVSVALFAMMVGLSATVMRAAGMAMLVLVARHMGRTSTASRGLALAALGMLAWNPYLLLYDPGFQLSFLATLGLVVVAPRVEEFLGWLPTRFQIREFVTATIATQIFVTPFILYMMGTVSVIALFANVLILSVVPLAMMLSLVAGVGGLLFGVAGMWVGFPAYVVLSYMLFVAEVLARVPFASFTVAPFSVWYVVWMYVAIGGVLGLLYYREIYSKSRAPFGAPGSPPFQ